MRSARLPSSGRHATGVSWLPVLRAEERRDHDNDRHVGRPVRPRRPLRDRRRVPRLAVVAGGGPRGPRPASPPPPPPPPPPSPGPPRPRLQQQRRPLLDHLGYRPAWGGGFPPHPRHHTIVDVQSGPHMG